jgi:hypothetical protein
MATPLTHAQLETLWASNGGDPTMANVAAAVAQAESGGDPSRINNTAYPTRPGYHAPGAGSQPEYSVGLWQVNMLAHPSYTEASLLTPAGNVAAAVTISNGGASFGAWSTYVSGAYRPFLSGAGAAPPGGPIGPVGSGTAAGARAPGAYHQLNRALLVELPAALRRANRSRRAALQTLQGTRKVKG